MTNTSDIIWSKSSRVDASPHVVSSSEYGCTCWAAHRAGGVELCHDETFTGQFADVWRV